MRAYLFSRICNRMMRLALAQQLLAAAIASIAGKTQERAAASLFSPGGTHALPGEFAGMGNFEVVAWLAVLP